MIVYSVRKRVTFWYAFVIIIMLIAVISIIFAAITINNKSIKNERKDTLSVTVRSVTEELKSSNTKEKKPGDTGTGRKDRDPKGQPDGDKTQEVPEDTDFAYFFSSRNGINFILYDKNGSIIKGELPEDINEEIKISANSFTEFKAQETTYIIFDYQFTKRGAEYYIRGIAPLREGDKTLKRLLLLSLIILPFFALIATIVGHKITKSALKPVKQITDMAHNIAESGDLTQRIGLKDGKDEIHIMADTFDEMLETIEEQFEARKRFTDDASHELRTPISVILGQCELAESEKDDPEEIIESVKAIKRQAKKMSKLVSQLLLFARVDKGKEKLNIEEIDLSETAEIVALELDEEAKEKHIDIKTDIEPGIIFKCDQALITRLIINLMTNAIKYGKENGFVDLSLKKDNGSIILKVSDNGIGIAPENIDKIWERFFRVDPSRTKKNDDGSSGLGLPIAKWITEAHNGTISVESELDKGSVFTVVFNEN